MLTSVAIESGGTTALVIDNQSFTGGTGKPRLIRVNSYRAAT